MRSVESSEVGEPSSWTGVRISDVVQGGQVENLSESMLAMDQPCISGTTMSPRSPGKRKRKKGEMSAPFAVKRRFEFDDESIVLPKERGVYFDDPNFAIALKVQDETVSSPRSGCSRRAAPVVQSSPR